MKFPVKPVCLCLLLLIGGFSFRSLGEEKVLDLGEIEITGEVRRPNINLIYSKKYIKKAIDIIAGEEFKKLEAELLKPALPSNKKTRTKKRIKRSGKTDQGISTGKTKPHPPKKQEKRFSSEKEGVAKETDLKNG